MTQPVTSEEIKRLDAVFVSAVRDFQRQELIKALQESSGTGVQVAIKQAAAVLGLNNLQAKPRRQRQRPPDGLHTASEAAVKLRCSIKTLNGHIAAGALKYVSIGHGTKRPRKMFAAADLDEFIANQTRKDVPACPSSARSARRTGITTSNGEVIGFTARRNARLGAKPKK